MILLHCNDTQSENHESSQILQTEPSIHSSIHFQYIVALWVAVGSGKVASSSQGALEDTQPFTLTHTEPPQSVHSS